MKVEPMDEPSASESEQCEGQGMCYLCQEPIIAMDEAVTYKGQVLHP